MFVVICYDITDNKLRSKISKFLEWYWVRVQRSVFECEFETKNQYEFVKEKLKEFIKRYGILNNNNKLVNIDSLDELEVSENVRFYILDKWCKVKIDIIGNAVDIYNIPPYDII